MHLLLDFQIRCLPCHLPQLASFFFCIFFVFFRAALEAHGGSQARGRIRAVATATAMPDPSHVCDLFHSSWQRCILNPLREARD